LQIYCELEPQPHIPIHAPVNHPEIAMTTFSRRTFVTRAAKLSSAVIAAPFVLPGTARAATRISFVSWGGSYGETTKALWIKPFTAETGIEVDYVTGPDIARLKAQVESKNVVWDVVDGVAYQAAANGLAEPLDQKILDPNRFTSKLHPFACPTGTYFGGIAYDPKRTPAPPKDFSEFWNVKGFAGRRGLRNRITEMLEIALLADGVDPAKLYPLDADRGFKALDRIKPSIKTWFAETGQGISLIQTGEVEYTYTYGSRVKPAKESGVSIDMALDQCITTTQYYFVAKGTPRKEAAMRFLEFITRPKLQADFIIKEQMTGAPVVKGVDSLIQGVKIWRPNPNSNKHVHFNDDYWGPKFVELDRRFKEWILS
jgi:putative spermidine/putrescine transport system substrate-binding protein